MRFANPDIFKLLLGALALLFLYFAYEKKRAKILSYFASMAQVSKELLLASGAKRKAKALLVLASLVLALLALARPQQGEKQEQVQTDGIDIAFLLDISNSMLTEDAVPSRLKKAKHILRNFLGRMSSDRVGVVAFAGSAFPAVPLTTDYDYINQTLDVINERSIPTQGSNLSVALDVAIDLLKNGGLTSDENEEGTSEQDSNASRAIIILSDGEAHDTKTAGELQKVVDRAKGRGIRIYSIAIGTEKGGPIPMRDDSGYLKGYKRDDKGTTVISKLVTDRLKAVAEKGGGKFFEASSNEGEVEEILALSADMSKGEGVGRSITVYDELFQYPLALAVACLILMLLLTEKKSAVTVLALLLLLEPRGAHAAKSVREYSANKEGVEAYEKEDFSRAVEKFSRAQALNPGDKSNHFNLGDAFFKAGNYDRAASEFEALLDHPDPNQGARAAFNLGKSFEAQKNREKALQSYQKGLDLLAKAKEADPEVEMRIKQALEEQAQKGGGGGESDNPDKQDDKKDDKGKEGQQKEQNPVKEPKRQKPQYKAEKLSESDAKKILQQLGEQEKRTQERMIRGKVKRGKQQDDNGKDW